MESNRPLESIPDDELLRRLAEILRQSRRVESDLVAHIAEAEERKLYAREASPSMFAYCIDVLHLSEAEAYLRIRAARASRKHPVLLDMLSDGRLHLTAIAMMAPYLTVENRDTLLERATHRTKCQIEDLIAELLPRPDVPGVMRKLPQRLPPGPERGAVPEPGADRVMTPAHELRPDAVEAPALELRPEAVAPPAPTTLAPTQTAPAVVQPLAPGRYKVQFTASAELKDKLERLRALMRSKVPSGDLAAIIEQAVTEKLERLEARRFAKTTAPRRGLAETNLSTSCALHPGRGQVRGEQARRTEVPLRGLKGATMPGARPARVSPPVPVRPGCRPQSKKHLMCQTHNAYLAERDYGKEEMARHRRSEMSPTASSC